MASMFAILANAPLCVGTEVKTVKKGNNDEASRKAHADKEAFMRQHAGLLESLLPGRTLNIATTKERKYLLSTHLEFQHSIYDVIHMCVIVVGAKSALGNILLSIWYNAALSQLHVFGISAAILRYCPPSV
jgi:hypothetical protein